jgi:hypothetical protein
MYGGIHTEESLLVNLLVLICSRNSPPFERPQIPPVFSQMNADLFPFEPFSYYPRPDFPAGPYTSVFPLKSSGHVTWFGFNGFYQFYQKNAEN